MASFAAYSSSSPSSSSSDFSQPNFSMVAPPLHHFLTPITLKLTDDFFFFDLETTNICHSLRAQPYAPLGR